MYSVFQKNTRRVKYVTYLLTYLLLQRPIRSDPTQLDPTGQSGPVESSWDGSDQIESGGESVP